MAVSSSSKASLVFDVNTEKVFFAVLLLQHHGASEWVYIDEIAELLREQQRLCERSGGKKYTALALWPPALFPTGWDDHRVVGGLARLTEKGLLKNSQCRENGHYFQCVPITKHGLYELRRPEEATAILQKPVGAGILATTEELTNE